MNPLHENVNIIEVNVDISITFSLQTNEDKLYKKNKTEIYNLTFVSFRCTCCFITRDWG